MNLDEFFNSDGTVVPNPDKKRKDDGKPEFIRVPVTRDMDKNLFAEFNESLPEKGQSYRIEGQHTAETYLDKGITITPDNIHKLDYELADAQGILAKAGSMLAQSLGEAVLGTAEMGLELPQAVSHALAIWVDSLLDKAFDVKGNPIQSTIGAATNDFSNPVLDKLKEFHDYYNNEIAPIYTRPDVDIQNGGFSDFGWYFSNLPSIFSSLTMLLPAKGAIAIGSKVLQYVTKGLRASRAERLISAAQAARDIESVDHALTTAERTEKALSKWDKLIYSPTAIEKRKKALEIGSDAFMMRAMENYSEAHQNYTEFYKDAYTILDYYSDEEYNNFINRNKNELTAAGININNRDDVAKWLAKQSADRTFAIDFSNVIFDALQLAGLRDMAKFTKNIKSSKINRLHKESLKEFKNGTTADAVKKQNPITKASRWMYDQLKNNAAIIAKESTEGAEEAINYIAQQEGLTFGQALLEGDTEAGWSSFWNNRLKNYLQNAECQESAFWGVMGGWLFGGLGTAFNRAAILKQNRDNLKLSKETDATTGENKMSLSELRAMSELPEIAAAKAGILKRTATYEKLKNDLFEIQNKRDPRLPRDENTNQYPDFTGDIETQQELARRAVKKNFVTAMTFNAMNSGTFDLTVDFLKSDAFKEALSRDKIADNVDEFVNDAIRTMESTEKVYNDELVHVNKQVAALNKLKPAEGEIPLDYVMQIARNNAGYKIQASSVDEYIPTLEKALFKQCRTAGINMTDKDFTETRNLVKLAQLTDMYSKLEADKQYIEKSKDRPKWATQMNLYDIKKQQENIMQQIIDVSLNNGATILDEKGNEIKISNKEKAFGYALWALKFGQTREKVLNGIKAEYPFKKNTNFIKTDDELIKEYNELFKSSNLSNATLSQLANVANDELNHVIGDEGMFKKSYDAFTTINELCACELQKATHLAQVATTQKQIMNEIDILHNMHNEIRGAMITKAAETILEIQDKYNGTADENIEQTIIKMFFEDTEEAAKIAREKLTGTDENGKLDCEKLIDALKIINFSQASNRQALDTINQLMVANAQKYKGTEKTEPVEETPRKKEEVSEQPVQQSSNIDEIFSNPNTNTQEQQAKESSPKVSITINKNGKIAKITNSKTGIPTKVNGDGFEVLIDGLDTTKQKQFVLNNAVFDLADGDLLEDFNEVVIKSNPIIEPYKKGYRLVEKGQAEVVKKEEYKTEEEKQEEVKDTQEEQKQEEEQKEEEQKEEQKEESAQSFFTGSQSQQESETDEDDSPVQVLANGSVIDRLMAMDKITDDNVAKMKEEILVKAQTAQFFIDNPDDLATFGDNIDKAVASVMPLVLSLKGSEKIVQAAGKLALHAKFEEKIDSSTKDAMTIKLNTIRNLEDLVDAFIEEYAKTQIVPEINGKKVVRFMDLLRLCNEAFNTRFTSTSAYNVLKNRLFSPSGQNLYIVIDADDVRDNSVLDKLYKTNEELREAGQDNLIVRLDLATIRSRYDNNKDNLNYGDKNKFYKALSELKAGDELRVVRKPYEILLYKDSVIVGRLPLPSYQNNGYMQYNEGWRYELTLNSQGQIVSPFKSFVINLFTNLNDPNCSNIRKLLAENIHTHKISQDTLSEFASNPIIKELLESKRLDNLIQLDSTTTIDDLFNHLLKLYKHSLTTKNTSKTIYDTQSQIISVLTDWFDNLYLQYQTITETDFGKTAFNVIVDSVTDGALNQIVPDATADNYNQLLPANKGLTDISKCAIGINLAATETKAQETHIAFDDKLNTTDFPVGWGTSTFVAIKNNDGKSYAYAKAYGLFLNNEDDNKNPLFVRIQNAVKEHLTDITTNLQATDNISERQNLENQLGIALTNIFATTGTLNNNKIELFRVANGQFYIQPFNLTTESGYNITWSSPTGELRTFSIVTRDDKGKSNLGYKYEIKQKNINGVYERVGKPVLNYSSKNENTAEMLADELFNFFAPVLQFNISKNGCNKRPISSGFIQYNPGHQLVIDIPTNNPVASLHQEFSDYNDLLLNHGMCRVNTKPSKFGNNFELIGNNNELMKKVRVKIPYISPVKKEDMEGYNPVFSPEGIESTVVSNDLGKIKDIINGESEHKGLDLLTFVKGLNRVSELANSAKAIGLDIETLFPNKIKYDADLNPRSKRKDGLNGVILAVNPTGDNPKYKANGKTRYLEKGMVVCGNKFLNMISSANENSRNQALRKLMHEQLHKLIHENNVSVITDEIKSFYNEFNELLDDDILSVTNPVDLDTLKRIKKVVNSYKRQDVLLEEFIVECMTNSEISGWMNSKRINYSTKKERKQNIFTKFVELLRKIFGYATVNDDSLYAKFLDTLSNLEYTTTETVITNETNETDNTVEPDNNDTEPITTQPETPTTQELDEDVFNVDNFGAFNSQFDETNKATFDDIKTIESIKSEIPFESRATFDAMLNAADIETNCN